MGMLRIGICTCLLAVLVVGYTTVGTRSSAEAKTPRCFGQEATIIGTEKSDELEGTRADDVIVALRGTMMFTEEAAEIASVGDAERTSFFHGVIRSA